MNNKHKSYLWGTLFIEMKSEISFWTLSIDIREFSSRLDLGHCITHHLLLKRESYINHLLDGVQFTPSLCLWMPGNPGVHIYWRHYVINLSSPGQNGHCFTDNIFKCICMNEAFCISLWISPKFFSLSVQLTINYHWLMEWLGIKQMMSHYLNQYWPSLLTWH